MQYTLTNVLPMLAMVETPAAAITVSHHDEPASKDEKEGLLETGTTVTLVHQKPITSSIRGTIRHLVAEGGKFRLRGYSCPLGLTAATHPEVCRAIEAFLAALVGAHVDERCERDGRPRCCFDITVGQPRAA